MTHLDKCVRCTRTHTIIRNWNIVKLSVVDMHRYAFQCEQYERCVCACVCVCGASFIVCSCAMFTVTPFRPPALLSSIVPPRRSQYYAMLFAFSSGNRRTFFVGMCVPRSIRHSALVAPDWFSKLNWNRYCRFVSVANLITALPRPRRPLINI